MNMPKDFVRQFRLSAYEEYHNRPVTPVRRHGDILDDALCSSDFASFVVGSLVGATVVLTIVGWA